MTRIQQVHWELTMDYIGHPYYVSGNAIVHALGQQLPYEIHRHLHASHGMFVPGQFGRFPDDHSQNGSHPYLGGGLPDVEAYDDLFLFRDPFHPWLLDSRPRDALNSHGVRVQSGHPALAHETIVGRPDDHQNDRKTTRWYVNAYLHADESDLLPLSDDVLDDLQFGGKRNYGYGTTRLKETQVVDLEMLDYARLEKNEAFILGLVSPFVLSSEYPTADDRNVPWWWQEGRDELREREEMLIEQCEGYRLRTVDHGQVVGYEGDRPIETAMSGLRRVGTHSKYGFGEFRVIPVPPQSERQANSMEGITAE